MGTLSDYISWRGDLTFEQAPLNEVDSLIFSLISYLDFKGIVPETHDGTTVPIRAAANAFFARNPDPKKISIGAIIPKDIIKIFRALKDCRRYRAVNMRAHVNVIDLSREMQFSATTFFPTPETMLVAFRGTDDTLVGWKEDFNMSFMQTVPAQAAAVSYLEEAASVFSGKTIHIAGHSKGGNLSVYAATRCSKSIKKKLETVWSHDGPGFVEGFLNDPDYIKTKHLIKSFVPQSSLIGMLMEHDENYHVVKSRQSGLWQHDGVSWEVMGASFVHLRKVTNECRRRDKTVNEWIRTMTPDQREQFVDALYQLLSANNATTLTDLLSIKNYKWLKKTSELDPHVYKTIQKTLAVLLDLNTKNIISDIFPKK